MLMLQSQLRVRLFQFGPGVHGLTSRSVLDDPETPRHTKFKGGGSPNSNGGFPFKSVSSSRQRPIAFCCWGMAKHYHCLTSCDQSPIFVGSMERDSLNPRLTSPWMNVRWRAYHVIQRDVVKLVVLHLAVMMLLWGTKLRFHVGCVAESPGAVAR